MALNGLKLCMEKPLSKGLGELIDIITKEGAEWVNLNKQTTHVVSNEWQDKRRAFKVGAQYNLPIVTEDWLNASLAAGHPVDVDPYLLADSHGLTYGGSGGKGAPAVSGAAAAAAAANAALGGADDRSSGAAPAAGSSKKRGTKRGAAGGAGAGADSASGSSSSSAAAAAAAAAADGADGGEGGEDDPKKRIKTGSPALDKALVAVEEAKYTPVKLTGSGPSWWSLHCAQVLDEGISAEKAQKNPVLMSILGAFMCDFAKEIGVPEVKTKHKPSVGVGRTRIAMPPWPENDEDEGAADWKLTDEQRKGFVTAIARIAETYRTQNGHPPRWGH